MTEKSGKTSRRDFASLVPSLKSPGTSPSRAPEQVQSNNRMEEDAICFLKKHNYMISAKIGQPQALMRAITPVLDSGAGPNIVPLQYVAEQWRSPIMPVWILPLIDASNSAMKSLGEISLYICIGEFLAPVQFSILAAPRCIVFQNKRS